MRLILHFDLNKTILISDAAQSLDISATLDSCLSEETWGTIGENGWILSKTCLSPTPIQPNGLISYGDFLRKQYPLLKGLEQSNRNIRTKLKCCFTDAAQPGHYFFDLKQKLMQKLRSDCIILPSFFSLLQHLCESDVKFSLVFRTFGTDSEAVANELNLLLQSNHPQYSFPNELLTSLRNALLPIQSTDYWYRSLDSTTLTLTSQNGKILNSLPSIYSYITRSDAGTQFMQDYYPFWLKSAEQAFAGKLLLIDPLDTSVIQCFLDDNILTDDAHIVDVRSVDGNHINHEFALFQVSPIGAILNRNYFIELISPVLNKKSP